MSEPMFPEVDASGAFVSSKVRQQVTALAEAVPTFAVLDRYKVGRFEPWSRHFAPVTYYAADFWLPAAESRWARVLRHQDITSLTLLNPDSGPTPKNGDGSTNTGAIADWQRQAQIVRNAGAFVLGYVSTQYGARAKADVMTDVRLHVERYQVDGVFLDEQANGWNADASVTNAYYADLYASIKAAHGAAFYVATNPGTTVADPVLAMADVLMTFEQSATAYLDTAVPKTTTTFYNHSPAKFWHVIYGITSAAQARAVLAAAEALHAGHVYLTDATLPNPYGQPPAPWLLDVQAEWCRRNPTAAEPDPGVYLRYVTVVTGNEPRPGPAGGVVMWIGGTATPAGMEPQDLRLAEGAGVVTEPALLTDFMGDSLTQAYADPRFPTRMAYSGPQAGAMMSGQKLRYRYNRGIGGQQTAHMLARFDADIINTAPRAEAVFILAGSNDSVSNIQPGAFMANIDAMVQKALAAGMIPIVCTAPPLRSDNPAGAHALLQAYRDALAGYTACTVLDTHSVLKNAQGYWDPIYMVDTVHPSPLGKQAMGEAIASQLAVKRPGLQPIPLSTTARPADTVLAAGVDAIFSAGTAAAPPGWTIWNGGNPPTGVTLSMTTPGNITGRAWRWTFNSSPDWTVLCTVKLDMSKLAVGDKVRIAGILNKSTGSSPAMTLYSTGIFGDEISRPLTDLQGGDYQAPMTGAVWATEFTMTSAITNIELSVMTNKAQDNSWFELAQITAHKI